MKWAFVVMWKPAFNPVHLGVAIIVLWSFSSFLVHVGITMYKICINIDDLSIMTSFMEVLRGLVKLFVGQVICGENC